MILLCIGNTSVVIVLFGGDIYRTGNHGYKNKADCLPPKGGSQLVRFNGLCNTSPMIYVCPAWGIVGRTRLTPADRRLSPYVDDDAVRPHGLFCCLSL